MLEIPVKRCPPNALTSVHVVGQLPSRKQHGQGEEECLSDFSLRRKRSECQEGLKLLNFLPCQALWLPWEVLHQPLNPQILSPPYPPTPGLEFGGPRCAA